MIEVSQLLMKLSKKDFLKNVVIKANKIHDKMDKKLLLDNNSIIKLFSS